jgi:hypothetical protein
MNTNIVSSPSIPLDLEDEIPSTTSTPIAIAIAETETDKDEALPPPVPIPIPIEENDVASSNTNRAEESASDETIASGSSSKTVILLPPVAEAECKKSEEPGNLEAKVSKIEIPDKTSILKRTPKLSDILSQLPSQSPFKTCAAFCQTLPTPPKDAFKEAETHGDCMANVTSSKTLPSRTPASAGDSGFKSIGYTPLIQIKQAPAFTSRLNTKFHMKCAYMSPTGSIKDHVAQALIENGLRKRSIRLDSNLTMIVPSSEALSVSAAHIGLQKGFKVTAVLPTQSRGSQRIKVLEQLGGNATFFRESDVH